MNKRCLIARLINPSVLPYVLPYRFPTCQSYYAQQTHIFLCTHFYSSIFVDRSVMLLRTKTNTHILLFEQQIYSLKMLDIETKVDEQIEHTEAYSCWESTELKNYINQIEKFQSKHYAYIQILFILSFWPCSLAFYVRLYFIFQVLIKLDVLKHKADFFFRKSTEKQTIQTLSKENGLEHIQCWCEPFFFHAQFPLGIFFQKI